MEWELVTEGPNHRFAGIENVLVAMYWGAPSAHSLRDRLPWAERTLETYGSLGQLVIIDRSTIWAMPTPEWRAESREQSKRFNRCWISRRLCSNPTTPRLLSFAPW